MSNVVCLMNSEADRATFTWSEGPASFEPYTLDGMVFKEFKEIATEAREKMADLVKDCLDCPAAMPTSAFELAEAGHELYQAMFQPCAEQARQARQVRQWLEQLARQNNVDSLEIVLESPWLLPWNIIYDQPPEREAFLSGDASPDRWKPFWGLRFNLAGGRKVDPLRRMPSLKEPKVLLVVDPEIRDGLPEEQQQRLAEFVDSHKLKMVHNQDELRRAITAERPDLLYWLSHASADALVLAGDEISPRLMRKLLRQNDDESFGGLAFLNACQTAEGGASGSFFEAFHSVGFAGMIGTEHQTVDQFANPLGLDFLEAFLDHGKPVGSALRELRHRVPLGLLYGTYCPPHLRVSSGNVSDSLRINQEHVQGVALGVEAAERPQQPLPEEPYRSLAYYDRGDRALFAGREDDVERFAMMLDDAATRILVLHGESGVGKSSFLHAGVIPYLEEECLGYRFLREQAAGQSVGVQGSVIFVRATNDLIGQLAQALCEFCGQPYEYETPLSDQASADLPGVLAELIGDGWNQSIVRAALRGDNSLLGQIMSALSDRLPFSAILVIDQGEEIFTLAQNTQDQQRGRQALDALRRTIIAAGDFKVIFSLRTEYYGRVIDRLRRGLHDTGGIREYLLTDFDEVRLFEAIRRPTVDKPIPYASEVPRNKYGFRYDEGVAEKIAHRVVHYTTQRRDSVLPLMQVICAQLYRRASRRTDRTILLADLDELGGIEGGMRNHVDGLLSELLKGRPSDRRPLQKMFTQLYIKQPDGTLTTALMAEDEVQKRWTGRMPLDELLQACQELRLLKVNTLRIGMEEERRYLSLGHDALAKLAAEWDEELAQSERLRQMRIKWTSRVAAVLAVLLVAGLVWDFVRRANEDKRAQLRVESLIQARPDALPHAIDLLFPLKRYAVNYLPAHVDNGSLPLLQRLHAACALAEFQPLTPEQVQFLADSIPNTQANECFNLITALNKNDNREYSVELLKQHWEAANEREAAHEQEVVNKQEAAMKVHLAVALFSLGESDAVRGMLKSAPDPLQRTLFIEHFSSWPGDLSVILDALVAETEIDTDFRSGLCLALGTLTKDSLWRYAPRSDTANEDIAQLLESALDRLHREATDSATHSASLWALKKWDAPEPKIESTTTPAEGFHWYTNELGMTMLLIPEGEFVMGSEAGYETDEGPTRQVSLPAFYLADRELTVGQFEKFFNSPEKDVQHTQEVEDKWNRIWQSKPADAPMQEVGWIDAIAFSNWLSLREKLTECYSYNEEQSQWELNPKASGYRLPTEAEWEYSCRAGTTTEFSCGDFDVDDEEDKVLLEKYAVTNCPLGLTASKMPNAWGLWDMHGNLQEWCQERYQPRYQPHTSLDPKKNPNRVTRGGSYLNDAAEARSARRLIQNSPRSQFPHLGFRVARNID